MNTVRQLNVLLTLLSGVLEWFEASGIGDPLALKSLKFGIDLIKSCLEFVE
jgi:hypothetical protein